MNDTAVNDTAQNRNPQNSTANNGATENGPAQYGTAANGPENGQQQPSDIIVLTPGATGPEIAAATAVLQDALKELAAEAAEPIPGRSPWLGSSRKLREPIGPGHPGWRSFNG